jgi:hypothetical protein
MLHLFLEVIDTSARLFSWHLSPQPTDFLLAAAN